MPLWTWTWYHSETKGQPSIQLWLRHSHLRQKPEGRIANKNLTNTSQLYQFKNPDSEKLKKLVKKNLYPSGRFVMTKHKLGFEKELPTEETITIIQKFLQRTREEGISMAERTFVFDVDFTVDLAIGFDPDLLEDYWSDKRLKETWRVWSPLHLLPKGFQGHSIDQRRELCYLRGKGLQ